MSVAGGGRRKEKGTKGRRKIRRTGSLRPRRCGVVLASWPIAGGTFDVALTVERGVPGGDTPGLAVTGISLLMLIALLTLLVALGLSALASAKRREADGRGG